MCPSQLYGINIVKPKVLIRLSKIKKYVSSAHGASMCAKCVHDRIECAFFIEKQKITVKMLKAKAQNQKAKKMKLFE